MFENDRSGDQFLFREQEKLFKPIINVQKETSRSLQDKLISSQETTASALMPMLTELQRRNDQMDILQQFPYYQAQIDQPVVELIPEKKAQMYIDLDRDLDDTDKENLAYMDLKLPSIVFDTDTYLAVIDILKVNGLVLDNF